MDERLAKLSSGVESEYDEVSGIRCVKLKLAIPNDPLQSEATVWLDPNCAYVPRKYQVFGNLPNRGWSSIKTWIANELTEHDGRTWWPMSGKLLEAGEENDSEAGFTWFVKAVKFNESMSRADFAAPRGTPGRTRIIDYLNTSVGGAATSPNESDATQTSPAPAGTPAVAVQPATHWGWLLCGSLVLLILGMGLRVFRKT